MKPKEILSAFIDFRAVTKATVRPKIQQLLLKRLSESLEMLSTSDLSFLVRATSQGDLHNTLQLGDFIINRLEMLSEADLRNCLIAFNLSASYKVVEVLEQHLIANLH